jgi:hypothetical protein
LLRIENAEWTNRLHDEVLRCLSSISEVFMILRLVFGERKI